MSALDAHERPPDSLRAVFKYHQKPSKEPDGEKGVVDFDHFKFDGTRFSSFCIDLTSALDLQQLPPGLSPFHGVAVEAKQIPGLYILPRLFSINSQLWLLERLLHRDLANEQHSTNLHKHYSVAYSHTTPDSSAPETDGQEPDPCRRSFFYTPPDSVAAFEPIDPSIHKPLPISQALNRKLRWITLGGQYDWTAKVYPEGRHPDFPEDIARLLRHVFPGTKPEAAIVNLYSPGDTLSLHRDVSEECAQGLVSVSIGCDALFVIGIVRDDGETEQLTLRLHSGDALLMSETARYAWHGVPRIIPDTCPPDLASWPAVMDLEDDPFSRWKGWLAGKRVNLNIRQMHD